MLGLGLVLFGYHLIWRFVALASALGSSFRFLLVLRNARNETNDRNDLQPRTEKLSPMLSGYGRVDSSSVLVELCQGADNLSFPWRNLSLCGYFLQSVQEVS